MKTCTHCAMPWPLSFYSVAGRRKDGTVMLRGECAFCRKQRRAELDAGEPRTRPWQLRGARVDRAPAGARMGR